MKKSEALQKTIKRKKDQNEKDFEHKVGRLIWAIEDKSQELKDLKKELTELTYKEIEIPDILDCIE